MWADCQQEKWNAVKVPPPKRLEDDTSRRYINVEERVTMSGKSGVHEYIRVDSYLSPPFRTLSFAKRA